MRYLDGITADTLAEADNPLILGTALHTGIERSLEEALHEYAFSFPIITDEHIHEMMKLETVIPLARSAIPKGGKFEVEIKDDDFHGFKTRMGKALIYLTFTISSIQTMFPAISSPTNFTCTNISLSGTTPERKFVICTLCLPQRYLSSRRKLKP